MIFETSVLVLNQNLYFFSIMIYGYDEGAATRCSLDSKKYEVFTQKRFDELIHDAHQKGKTYYIARIQAEDSKGKPYWYSYDAKQLCKFIFEIVITSEGRKIGIKNFIDPLQGYDIQELGFYKIEHNMGKDLRAEYIGNHLSFLESSAFRSEIFYDDQALEALSVNFQFKEIKSSSKFVPKRKFAIFIGLMVSLLIIGSLLMIGFQLELLYLGRKKLDETNINLNLDKQNKHIAIKADNFHGQATPLTTQKMVKNNNKEYTDAFFTNNINKLNNRTKHLPLNVTKVKPLNTEVAYVKLRN